VPEPGSPLLQAPAAERVKVSSTGTSAADTMSLDQSQGRAWHADSAYDRRSPTCCVPWQWESGQVSSSLITQGIRVLLSFIAPRLLLTTGVHGDRLQQVQGLPGVR
jgi:hypothetical protein